MLPVQPHRQFRHPFHSRFLRRFLAYPPTDTPKINWFLQSSLLSLSRINVVGIIGQVSDANVQVGDAKPWSANAFVEVANAVFSLRRQNLFRQIRRLFRVYLA
jgi:hypothetical protein